VHRSCINGFEGAIKDGESLDFRRESSAPEAVSLRFRRAFPYNARQ